MEGRWNPLGWLRLEGRVDRVQYAVVGFGLMLLKYLVEALLVQRFTGETWTPLEYFNPLFAVRMKLIEGGPRWLLWFLLAWTLPFVWVGVAMTLRRAVDAGHSAWLCVLFFVPLLNYLLMLALVAMPTVPGAPATSGVRPAASSGLDANLRGALVGAALAAVGGLATVYLTVKVLEQYSAALFVGAPFVIGAVASFFFNRPARRSLGATVGMICLSLLFFAGVMLLLAAEGVLCLAMALPIGLVTAIPGALIGREIAALGRVTGRHATLALLTLPLEAGVEAGLAQGLHAEVVSSIEIDAPPEAVWPHVIGFSELPEPHRLIFRLGVACPRRARIEGEGVGAVRHCEFSTGAFVEPITRWEPPHRLSFDVLAQPPSMTELSLYDHVDAPHLDGFVRSERGEFRLVALPGGRTRLEGSTWYELRIAPQTYWRLWSDWMIGSIHDRVLEHVKREVEAAQVDAPSSTR